MESSSSSPVTTRSLHTTLVSCASTLAIYLVTPWGDPFFMFSNFLEMPRLKKYAVMLCMYVGWPWVAISVKVLNVVRVRRMMKMRRRSERLQKSAAAEDLDTTAAAAAEDTIWKSIRKWWKSLEEMSQVGIMTVCPILIPIPPYYNDLPYFDAFGSIVTSSRMKRMSPLIMRVDGTAAAVVDDVPLEPTAAADYIRNTHSYSHGHLQLDDGNRRYLYIDVTSIEWYSKDLPYRLALLDLDLAPPFNQLSFLRTRSWFQVVVTVLQALGFVMSVVERGLVHKLPVSPVELLVVFYAFNSMVHVGLDLYACGSFQTPMLLSLTPSQFHAFMSRGRQEIESPTDTSYTATPYTDVTLAVFVMTVCLALFAVAAAPGIYFTFYFCRHDASSSSSAATRAVFPVFLISYVSTVLLMFLLSRDCCVRYWGRTPLNALYVMAPLPVAAALILAVISTVTDREHFDLTTAGEEDNMFAWIFN